MPFPAVVLEHLGIEKCSQHLNAGGSGIGLLDLWKLKSSSKATLLIKEDSSPDTLYTKYVYLIFDNQGTLSNSFSLRNKGRSSYKWNNKL